MARTNKKEVQVEKKRRHREHLKKKERSCIGSRSEPDLARDSANIAEKRTFLIICEGKSTEPSYFNGFKLKSLDIKVVGEGHNTISLVRRALQIVQKEAKKGNTFDEVWCVFDKDSFSNSNFNEAISLALENNMKVGYSNQCFEYWLFLHFNDHQGGKMPRVNCANKLNKHLSEFNVEYESNGCKKIEREFFELMLAKEKNTDKKTRVEKAINRAEAIDKKLDNKNPALEESSTKVYLLVREIMKDFS